MDHSGFVVSFYGRTMSSLLMGTWTDHVIITHGGMPSEETEEVGTSQAFHTVDRVAAANGSNRIAHECPRPTSTDVPTCVYDLY